MHVLFVILRSVDAYRVPHPVVATLIASTEIRVGKAWSSYTPCLLGMGTAHEKLIAT